MLMRMNATRKSRSSGRLRPDSQPCQVRATKSVKRTPTSVVRRRATVPPRSARQRTQSRKRTMAPMTSAATASSPRTLREVEVGSSEKPTISIP